MMESGTRTQRMTWGLITGFLLLQGGLAIDCARRWTPTHDEYWHLPLGLHAWRTGDVQADPINPPLPRMWAAWPLWLTGVAGGTVVPPGDAYAVGDAFLEAQREQHRSRFFIGRLMLLPGLALGGACLAVWAGGWWGRPAALLATVLWVGCPLLIVHGALVTHDFPVTLAVLAATAWQRERPHRWGGVLIGGLLGVACLTKLSAINLFLIIPVFWGLLPGSPRPGGRAAVRGMLQITLTTWGVIQLGYLGDTLVHGTIPLPLPGGFHAGFNALRQTVDAQHPVFLNGEWRLEGFRTYYLWGLWYLMPLGFWLSTALVLSDVRQWFLDRVELRRMLAMLWVIVAIIGPPSFTGNQLGVRYVLPAVPVLLLFASRAVVGVSPWRRRSLVVIGVLTLASLRQHPHHFGAQQELAFGLPREHLVDANLDWGQDLHALRDWMNAHPSPDELHLAYFGTVSPSRLGLEYSFPPQRFPVPGRSAVSVSFVAGRPHHLRDLNGQTYTANLDDFGYFRFFQPTVLIGSSIAVYDLTPEAIARYHAAVHAAHEQ